MAYAIASFRKLYYDCDVPRPVWTVDPAYVSTAIIVFIIQTLFFALRIAARFMKMGTWGLDDTTCVIAYVRHPFKKGERPSKLTRFIDIVDRTTCRLCTW